MTGQQSKVFPLTSCRRCNAPLPPSKGPARVYCGNECRRVYRNELRLRRGELEDARGQLAFYSRQALNPLPGMATPAHALREVVRWEAVVTRIESEIRTLLKERTSS